jgi:hypothetical protein
MCPDVRSLTGYYANAASSSHSRAGQMIKNRLLSWHKYYLAQHGLVFL